MRGWLALHAFGDEHSLGGVAGVLDRYVEGVFAELAHRGLGDRVRRVMLALVCCRGGAAQATQRVVGRDRLARDWDVVEEFTRRRLLMIDEPTDDRRLLSNDGRSHETYRDGGVGA